MLARHHKLSPYRGAIKIPLAEVLSVVTFRAISGFFIRIRKTMIETCGQRIIDPIGYTKPRTFSEGAVKTNMFSVVT